MPFKKAECQKAALKIAVYGPAGSGKTLTSLLIAESLVEHTKKRIAYVDTETGAHFFSKPIPARHVHPAAFDFDTLETRALSEVNSELRRLKMADYGVAVIDSATHLWEAAVQGYNGNRDKHGKIPLHSWGGIKKPWKQLIEWVLNTPMHVVICGRMGARFDTDDDGELVASPKFKAEGETGYEPDFLFRMDPLPSKKGETTYRVYVEKDRTGVLGGKMITIWDPEGDVPRTAVRDRLVRPLLGLLGDKHAPISTQDETAMQDQEAFERAEQEKAQRSKDTRERCEAQLRLAETIDAVKEIDKGLTKEAKAAMVSDDRKRLRAAFQGAVNRIAGKTPEPEEQAPGEPPEMSEAEAAK